MGSKYDDIIPYSRDGIAFYGVIKRGAKPELPLIVLLHGGGTTLNYFDNPVASVVKHFNDLGHTILNISRPGYSGAPLPKTSTPFMDSILAFINYIDMIYHQFTSNHEKNSGIVPIGHSIGGSLALSIAYEAKDRLPILGVSVMGSLPSKEPLDLFPGLDDDTDTDSPRYVTEPSAENIRRFMGEVEWLHPEALSESLIASVFEPAIKSELREYLTPATNDYLLDIVLPGITVPVQFLAAELDLIWDSEEKGRPTYDALVARFESAPTVDAAILLRGGHNYEFSKNVGVLVKKREEFIEGLVTTRP